MAEMSEELKQQIEARNRKMLQSMLRQAGVAMTEEEYFEALEAKRLKQCDGCKRMVTRLWIHAEPDGTNKLLCNDCIDE